MGRQSVSQPESQHLRSNCVSFNVGGNASASRNTVGVWRKTHHSLRRGSIVAYEQPKTIVERVVQPDSIGLLVLLERNRSHKLAQSGHRGIATVGIRRSVRKGIHVQDGRKQGRLVLACG